MVAVLRPQRRGKFLLSTVCNFFSLIWNCTFAALGHGVYYQCVRLVEQIYYVLFLFSMVWFSLVFIGAAIWDTYFMFMYNNICTTYMLSHEQQIFHWVGVSFYCWLKYFFISWFNIRMWNEMALYYFFLQITHFLISIQVSVWYVVVMCMSCIYTVYFRA